MDVNEVEDRDIQLRRLREFVRPMLPIAVAYDALYLAAALYLKEPQFFGGAAAVLLFVLALVAARAWLIRGALVPAATIVGASMLAMNVVGAVFLPFLYPALLLIGIAAATVVIGYLSGARLMTLLVATLVAELWVAAFGLFVPPLFDEPPAIFARALVFSAIAIAAGFTLFMLWLDATRLRRSVIERENFLAIASHELKTPLASLALVLDGMSNKLKTAEDGNASWLRDRVDRGKRSVRRLDALIQTLLDVTRLRKDTLELSRERVDLAELVDEAVTRMKDVSPDQPLDVRTTAVEGDWDRLRIEQVVTNLLVNAVKYGNGKPITVSVEGDAAEARLTVRDEGIGIAPADQARVFEPFARAVSTTEYGGFGLGLWSSRRIVEAHGGTISLRSEPGAGTTFTVQLPRVLAAAKV